MKNVRKQFKNERMKRGITQQMVAELLNVDATAVSKFENGEGSCHLGTAEDIANAMGCDMLIELVDKNHIKEIFDNTNITYDSDYSLSIESKEQDISERSKQFWDDHFSESDRDNSAVELQVCGNRNPHLILDKIQNQILEQVLKMDLENLTENDVMIIYSKNDNRLIREAISYIAVYEDNVEKFNEDLEWSFKSILNEVSATENTIYLTFSKFFFKYHSKKKLIEKIYKKNKNEIDNALEYIESHPHGYPFLCYYRGRKEIGKGGISIGYDQTDVSELPFKLISSWNADAAINQFLSEISIWELRAYYEDYLINDLIEIMFFDEINTLETSQEFKNWLSQINDKIWSDDESEEITLGEYREKAYKVITKIEFWEKWEIDTIGKLFVQLCYYDVICFLCEGDMKMYNYIER